MANFDDLFGKNKDAIARAGGALGLAADLSGAGGLVIGVIDVLTGHADDVKVALGQILVLIQQLYAEERAQHILDRLRALSDAVADAETELQTLKATMQGNPSHDERVVHIQKCVTAVNKLNDPSQWVTNFLDEVYYSDPFGGAIEPQQQDLVFTTKFILAQYLYAVFLFVVVVEALLPDFPDLPSLLRSYVKTLHWAHDTAMQGITLLRAPVRDELWTSGAENGFGVGFAYPDDHGFMRSLWSYAREVHALFIWSRAPIQPPAQPQFRQMYGAVDRFGAYQSVGNYPGLIPRGLPLAPMPPTDRFFAQFYVKLNLALMKSWKDVYVGLGLPVVWNVINRLNQMAGDSPQPGVDRGYWSLAEIYQTIKAVALPVVDGHNRLRASGILGTLAAFRGKETWPLSFREQIDALPYPDSGVDIPSSS